MRIFHKIWQLIRLKRDKNRFKLYNSIEFLPVWNFYKVIETGDVRYIFKLKDYDTLPVTDYSPISQWQFICEQYFKESTGVKYFQYKNFRAQILTLRKKYILLYNAMYALCLMKDKELIELVRELGYNFDDSSENNYANSLINLDNQLKGLKKKIELKQNEFDTVFLSKGKSRDIYEMIQNVEAWKGFKLDIFKLTVKQFLNYQSAMNKEYNKQVAKSLVNGKG